MLPATVDGTPGRDFIWAADGVDVAALLRGAFHLEAVGIPDTSRTPTMASAGAFWMSLRLRMTRP